MGRRGKEEEIAGEERKGMGRREGKGERAGGERKKE
jgi:hypothetical protein